MDSLIGSNLNELRSYGLAEAEIEMFPGAALIGWSRVTGDETGTPWNEEVFGLGFEMRDEARVAAAAISVKMM